MLALFLYKWQFSFLVMEPTLLSSNCTHTIYPEHMMSYQECLCFIIQGVPFVKPSYCLQFIVMSNGSLQPKWSWEKSIPVFFGSEATLCSMLIFKDSKTLLTKLSFAMIILLTVLTFSKNTLIIIINFFITAIKSCYINWKG